MGATKGYRALMTYRDTMTMCILDFANTNVGSKAARGQLTDSLDWIRGTTTRGKRTGDSDGLLYAEFRCKGFEAVQ